MRQAVPKWAEVLAKYEQHAPCLFEIEYCWSKKMDWVVFEDETIISFCIIFCIDKAHHDVLTVGTCSAVEMMLGQHICLFPFTRIHFSYITLALSRTSRSG